MALFTVDRILSGNKIRIRGGWEWNGVSGSEVIIAGYNTAAGNEHFSAINEQLAKNRLVHLIEGKSVELGRVFSVDRNCITCLVFYNGIDIAKYFPEYTRTSRI